MSIKTLQNGQWVDVYGGIDKTTSLADELKLDITLSQQGLAAESYTVGQRLGDLTSLKTDNRKNLVGAINELQGKVGAGADIVLVKGEKEICNSNYEEIKKICDLSLEDSNADNPKKIIFGLFDNIPAIFRNLSVDIDQEPIAIFYASNIKRTSIESREFHVYSNGTYKIRDYTYNSPINNIVAAQQGQVVYVVAADLSGKPTRYATMDLKDLIPEGESSGKEELFIVQIKMDDNGNYFSNYSFEIIQEEWKKNKIILLEYNDARYPVNYFTTNSIISCYPILSTNDSPQIIEIKINLNQSVNISTYDVSTIPAYSSEDYGKFLKITDSGLKWINAVSDIIVSIEQQIIMESIENEDGELIEQSRIVYLSNYSSDEINRLLLDNNTIICKYNSNYYYITNYDIKYNTYLFSKISFINENIISYETITIDNNKNAILNKIDFSQIPNNPSTGTVLYYNGTEIIWNDFSDFLKVNNFNAFLVRLTEKFIINEETGENISYIVSDYSSQEIVDKFYNNDYLILGATPENNLMFLSHIDIETIENVTKYIPVFVYYNFYENKINTIKYFIKEDKTVESIISSTLGVPGADRELDDGKFLCYSGINDSLEWKELSNIFLVNLNINSYTADYSSTEIYQNFLSGKTIILTVGNGYYILPSLITNTSVQFKVFEKENNNIVYYQGNINENKRIELVDSVKSSIISVPTENDYNKILTYTDNGIIWKKNESSIPISGEAKVGQTIVVNKVDSNTKKPTEWIVTDFPESSGNVTIDTVATVGQMIVVSEVDSKNKPIKWQAINIPQSDYEQSNSVHNEFIKNRPFYKNINILFDNDIETKLINSKTLNSILINEYSTILNLNTNFVENEKYQITLKNRLIEEVAIKETSIVSPLRNCIYIGNPRLYLEYYYFKNIANNTSWDDILIEYPAYIAAKTALPNNGKDYLFVYNGTQTLFFTDSPLSTHLYIRQSNLIIDEDYSVLFQSDWEQQNNLSYNYIKNKPFGDEHYIEIIPATKEGTTSPWTFADFTIDTENNQINFTNPQNEETWIQVKQQPSSNISINLTATDGTVTTYTLEPSAYKEVDEYYAYYGNLYLFDNNYPESNENFCLFIKSERTNTITDIFSSEKVRAISEMILKFSSDYVIDNTTAVQISQTTIDKIDVKYLSGEIVKKLVTFPANEGQYLKVEEVDNHGFVTRLGTYDNIEIPSFNLNNYLGLLSGGFEIDGGPKTTNANDEIGRIRKLLAENVVEISFTIRVGGIGGIIGGEEITFTNIVTPVYVSSTDIYQAFFKSAYNDGYIDVYLTFNPNNTITIELKTSDSFKIDIYNLIDLGMPDLILNGNAQTISLDTTNISKIQKSLDKGITKFIVNLKNPENDEIIQTIIALTGEQQTSYNGYSISQTFIDDSYGVVNIRLDSSNSSITASYQQLNSRKQMDDIMNKLRTLADYGFFVEDDGKGNLLIHSRMITATDDGNGNTTVLSDIITAVDDGNNNVTIIK